ncbi:MAG: sugar ABC transporter permease [Bacilli bacterium]
MKKERRKIKAKTQEAIIGTLFAGIPVIGFLTFGILPLIFSIMMSFSDVPSFALIDMSFLTSNPFQNYIAVLRDPLFYKAVLNTFYATAALPVSICLGLLLAIILNQKLKLKRLYRTFIFIPYVCSIVAVVLMWRTMLNTNFGPINQFLGFFGVAPIDWLTSSKWFMPGMIIMSIWCGTGFSMILYSAALSSINPAYYEAAELDGANIFQRFFGITLPLVSPTTFFLLVVGMIGSLQEFTRFQAINAVNSSIISPTGPDNSGLTIVFYLYNKAFGETGGLGQAASVSWILAAATILLTVFNFKMSRKWVYED